MHLGPGAGHLVFDLRSFGSEDRLVRKLFEQDETVETWKQDASELTLTFDSVDECLIRIDTLASILEEGLRELPTVPASVTGSRLGSS